MLTLVLGARDLAQVRFAFSPLWECVAAFRAWREPARHAVHLPWIAEVERAARGHDFRALDAAVHGTAGFFPDFLSPTPVTPLARFQDEVAVVRRTPPDILRRELAAAHPEGLPRALARADRAPRALANALADQLGAFWQQCVRPIWPRVRARLDAEILVRSRALALGGASALFDALHPQVRWHPRGAGGRLTVAGSHRFTRQARGAGVVLIPSVFSWPDVYATAHPPWRPNLAYPARGLEEPPPRCRSSWRRS
ncbi:MAG: transcriptional regulator [Gemmatimonadetes bacterium]|nr:transcriptional regulator [Gemmatimonadota bacterium]